MSIALRDVITRLLALFFRSGEEMYFAALRQRILDRGSGPLEHPEIEALLNRKFLKCPSP